MKPNYSHINYLIKNSFIRNQNINYFIEDNNNIIKMDKYICYTKGLINNLIVIQSFLINKIYITGIQSYEITWWNTFNVSSQEEIDEIVPITFCVHSGMSLRKNFFLFTDRFNLFKSTFIFDKVIDFPIRLFEIKEFLFFNEFTPTNEKIFCTPNKFFKPKKTAKKRMKKRKSIAPNKFIKLLLIIKNKCNYQNCLTRHYPIFYKELEKIIQNGNSTSDIISTK